MHTVVHDNNVERSIKTIKKKLQREGFFRRMKQRRVFEKPSEQRKREKNEAVRRYQKLARSRMEREDF